VTNGIPLGCLLLLPVGTVNWVQTLKAGVGANYSPLDYNPHGGYTQFQYWYPVNKAVTIYREQAMTLPWSEDYTYGAHFRLSGFTPRCYYIGIHSTMLLSGFTPRCYYIGIHSTMLLSGFTPRCC
jgi:hypothetical protein